MSRITCETAAQCDRLAEAMNAVVEPTVMALVVGTVAVAVVLSARTVVKDRE